MRAALFFLFALLGTGALAQDDGIVTSLSLDLNGDGLVEGFTLLISETGEADLQITKTGGNDIYAVGLGSTGPGADQPELAIRGDGQITITSHHDAQGPIRWTEILSLAFPTGAIGSPAIAMSGGAVAILILLVFASSTFAQERARSSSTASLYLSF